MSVTFRQGKQIQALRGRNLGYRAIAAQMGISRDTVRNYCVAHQLSGVRAGIDSKPPKACLCCGTELVQPSRGRKRKFCSDACCRKWWSENPQAIRQSPEALYESTCLNCGKTFTAYGNSHRPLLLPPMLYRAPIRKLCPGMINMPASA